MSTDRLTSLAKIIAASILGIPQDDIDVTWPYVSDQETYIDAARAVLAHEGVAAR